MQQINKASTKIMQRLVEGLNQMEDSKIIKNNDVFLPVHIQVIGEVHNQGVNGYGKLISVAHYVEQNGDLLVDPEICFLECVIAEINKKTYEIEYVKKFFPYYIKQIIGREDFYGKVEDGNMIWDMSKLRSQKDCASFANIWMRNIKEQQFK